MLQDSVFNLIANLDGERDLLEKSGILKQLNTTMLSSFSLEELFRLEYQLIEAHKEGEEEPILESYESLEGIPMMHFTLGSFCYYYLQDERSTAVPEYRIFIGDNSHKKDYSYTSARMHDFEGVFPPYGVLIASEIEKFGCS